MFTIVYSRKNSTMPRRVTDVLIIEDWLTIEDGHSITLIK